MPKQKNIMLIIFIIVTVALAIWGYVIFKDRYADNANKVIISNKNESSGENPDTNLSDNLQSNASENATEVPSSPVPEKTPFIEIKREDCLNNCKRFSNNQELTYCKQSCGLSAAQNNTDNCNAESGLDKDYCFKDLAIKEQDFKICEKISDKGIRKACTTRLTEDLLDNTQNSSTLPE